MPAPAPGAATSVAGEAFRLLICEEVNITVAMESVELDENDELEKFVPSEVIALPEAPAVFGYVAVVPTQFVPSARSSCPAVEALSWYVAVL